MDLWSGSGALRVLLIGVPVYAAIVLVLRLVGKRTLAKMNAFDLVVTIALGSVLGGSLINPNIALSTSLAAIALLVALQFSVSWLILRSDRFLKLVRAEPSLLFYDGSFLDDALKSERITQEEVVAALRADGLLQFDQVQAVVLETDGSFSVMPKGERPPHSLLATVKNFSDTDITHSRK